MYRDPAWCSNDCNKNTDSIWNGAIAGADGRFAIELAGSKCCHHMSIALHSRRKNLAVWKRGRKRQDKKQNRHLDSPDRTLQQPGLQTRAGVSRILSSSYPNAFERQFSCYWHSCCNIWRQLSSDRLQQAYWMLKRSLKRAWSRSGSKSDSKSKSKSRELGS